MDGLLLSGRRPPHRHEPRCDADRMALDLRMPLGAYGGSVSRHHRRGYSVPTLPHVIDGAWNPCAGTTQLQCYNRLWQVNRFDLLPEAVLPIAFRAASFENAALQCGATTVTSDLDIDPDASDLWSRST